MFFEKSSVMSRRSIFVGDWDKLKNYVTTGLKLDVEKAGDEIGLEVTTKLASLLRQEIKRRRLYRSGRYYNATGAYKSKSGYWYAGVPDELHSPGGIKLGQLAWILEFGTKKMRSRPHYRHAYAKIATIVKQVIIRKGFKWLGKKT
jgi:hypothetical protein